MQEKFARLTHGLKPVGLRLAFRSTTLSKGVVTFWVDGDAKTDHNEINFLKNLALQFPMWYMSQCHPMYVRPSVSARSAYIT